MKEFKVTNGKLALFAVLYISIGFVFAMALKSMMYVDFSTGAIEVYGRVIKVGCGSNSMGLSLDCMDELAEVKVSPDEMLRLGEIYIYNVTNHTVVHRLVGCVDNDCNLTVFKGDNNKVAEFVSRSDILYRVTSVRYR